MPESPETAPVATAGLRPQTGIVVRGVRRTFGDVVAVDRIDLDAPAGEVTALVGPNGAGKTTLMLMLATLLAPHAGEMWISGRSPVREPREVRAALGWMPDSFGSYDSLTVTEVLRFFAAAYRLPPATAASRTAELLELVHLTEYAAQPVHVLSKGQKQRLGLARALVHDPSVLILDEPAAGLDPRSRIELRGVLRGLAAQGKTVLVSSHILSELEEMADRVVFVDHGRTLDQHRMSDIPHELARPWRLHALDDDVLVAALAARGVEHGPPTPMGVEVLLATETEAAALLAGLVADGVAVVSCAPAGSSLEAAYLARTEGRK